MRTRILAGSLASFLYGGIIGKTPVGIARQAYLKMYLGGMGGGTFVQMGCRFLNGRKVHLGERNVINFGCLFDGRKFHIRTGNDVSIGPEATILTLGHDPQSPDFAERGADVVIGDRVWIGYGALILPGVTLGEGVVVGAAAVVTKNVPAYAIVAGNPARQVGERNQTLRYSLDYQPPLL